MKIKLKNIKPNPFRHIEHYPIQKEKVTALRESIKSTTFWDNIVARQRNGDAEIAYGHHRLEALREEYGPNHEVDLILRPLDDATMIQIMARENMEQWGSSAWVEMETVKSVVEAFADGKIALKKVEKTGPKRYAPSFIKGEANSKSSRELAYDALTVADFIGWNYEKVKKQLQALELIEKGVLKESQFHKLGANEAKALVRETEETLRWRERSPQPHHKATAIVKAREVGAEIAKTFQADQEGGGTAKARAEKVRAKIDRARPKITQDINPFVDELCRDLAKILSARDQLTQEIRAVLENIDSLGKTRRADLQYGLEMVAHRANSLAKLVKSGKIISPRETQRLLMNS